MSNDTSPVCQVIPPGLLAETRDTELQAIVEEAANGLKAPIALVTLVLDHIQLFKAHCGLPRDLAVARGTHRDVSFCQYVVKDGQALVVNDAKGHPRLPQLLVEEYGVRAYLGCPISVNDQVVGSLCVIDTEPRSFSGNDIDLMTTLAKKVDARFSALSERREDARRRLTDQATGPALAELRGALDGISASTRMGAQALEAIRSYLRLAGSDASVSDAMMRSSLEAATSAAEMLGDAIDDVAMSTADADDCARALTQLTTHAATSRLSDVLTAAQDLARDAMRNVGPAPLPDLTFDPITSAPRPLAVAVVTRALTRVAQALATQSPARQVIGLRVTTDDARALVWVGAGLDKNAVDDIASELQGMLRDDPSIQVEPGEDAVGVAFFVAAPSSAPVFPEVDRTGQ